MSEPRILWQPDPAAVARSRIAAFRTWLASSHGVQVADYAALWRWSVRDLEGFWGAFAQFAAVRFHTPPHRVLAAPTRSGAEMPGARWFPGATLNYAEHALGTGPGKGDDDPAVIFRREDGAREHLSYGQVRRRVAAARAALAALGVSRGDRVAALAPNSPDTLVAFLATASLGAIWSSCSPDFGARAVADRFTQIEPTVLIAVHDYRYGGRSYPVRSTVDALGRQIPSLQAVVPPPRWDRLLAEHAGAAPAFEAVDFDHPLWVLYSSGTTGLPKSIVHGHGGIVLEHLKKLMLQSDLGPGDRFFWFTTTGWMMWNYLISGLLVGATIVLYDGSPAHPDLDTLWQLAEQERITYFGTSAPFVQACRKAGLRPGKQHDLAALRAIGSTGAPLSAEGFRWLSAEIGPEVQICSVSGGTDVCTAFVCAAPDVPVWEGEISCRALGAAVVALDGTGAELLDEVGELVITRPMPSMPVSFWNDPDGTRLREAYFDTYPGRWRHGDWIRITPRGSCVIYGRSDATLNRGGVRMGTAEFYAVVEGLDEVVDSLVIDTSGTGLADSAHSANDSGSPGSPGSPEDGELLCFLVLAPGVALADVEPRLRAALRQNLSPRHVPDRFIVIDEVPRTLNGKKCEVPVKRILAGVDPERAVSADALRNPEALRAFRAQRS
ncbi:MAG TPA: acetoacetate--CoA ligase [Pseudonocardiaceae bacterium]|jgi:acetoacetyl-CoA synthetase|nr:acetoacetate--CoA ligase [Pseudonocardiaceae bacterium]